MNIKLGLQILILQSNLLRSENPNSSLFQMNLRTLDRYGLGENQAEQVTKVYMFNFQNMRLAVSKGWKPKSITSSSSRRPSNMKYTL